MSARTLVDNIWTNIVSAGIGSGLVTVRISDHLPIFAFVGGEREGPGAEEQGVVTSKRRLMNEGRMEKMEKRSCGGGFMMRRELWERRKI